MTKNESTQPKTPKQIKSNLPKVAPIEDGRQRVTGEMLPDPAGWHLAVDGGAKPPPQVAPLSTSPRSAPSLPDVGEGWDSWAVHGGEEWLDW